MRTIVLRGTGDFTEWRDAARDLLAMEISPQRVDWRMAGEDTLFPPHGFSRAAPRRLDQPPPRVPRSFLDLAEAAICHTNSGRFALLYRLLTRLQADRALLADAVDPDVASARRLEKSVRRDCHKMTAFVRFREVPGRSDDGLRRRFVAWFEPDHHIVSRMAPFFARRFADMDWKIATPKGSAVFENGDVAVSDAPMEKPDLTDPTDALWLTYYASIFNPARLKPEAMRAEMPKKYWRNLPEAALIPALIAEAPARVAAMASQATREPPAFHARLRARGRAGSAQGREDALPT